MTFRRTASLAKPRFLFYKQGKNTLQCIRCSVKTIPMKIENAFVKIHSKKGIGVCKCVFMDDFRLKARCHIPFTHAFIALGCVFLLLTLFCRCLWKKVVTLKTQCNAENACRNRMRQLGFNNVKWINWNFFCFACCAKIKLPMFLTNEKWCAYHPIHTYKSKHNKTKHYSWAVVVAVVVVAVVACYSTKNKIENKTDSIKESVVLRIFGNYRK